MCIRDRCGLVKEHLYFILFELSALWLVSVMANWVMRCELPQSAVAATCHSADWYEQSFYMISRSRVEFKLRVKVVKPFRAIRAYSHTFIVCTCSQSPHIYIMFPKKYYILICFLLLFVVRSERVKGVSITSM